MKLDIWAQVIDFLHDFFEHDSDDCRNDFPDQDGGEVDDPYGGKEGITWWDEHSADQEFERD